MKLRYRPCDPGDLVNMISSVTAIDTNNTLNLPRKEYYFATEGISPAFKINDRREWLVYEDRLKYCTSNTMLLWMSRTRHDVCNLRDDVRAGSDVNKTILFRDKHDTPGGVTQIGNTNKSANEETSNDREDSREVTCPCVFPKSSDNGHIMHSP